MSRSRAILWDFDGTLAYRRGGMWAAAMVEVASRQPTGLRVTAGQLAPYLQTGFPWHTPERPHPELRTAEAWWAAQEPVFERAYRGAGVDKTLASELARSVRRVYADPRRWRLFDDTAPALSRLSGQGWTHIIVSNHVPELRRIVSHLSLEARIEHVVNSAETGFEKPHPLAFRFALDRLARGTEAVVIGDSVAADIEGARAAGLPAILVRTPGPGDLPYSPDLGSIPGLLEEMTGRPH